MSRIVHTIKYILLLISLLTTLPEAQAQKRPKVGLVLSGGGAKGLAHVGVIKVLEEVGIHPDYITGTSMGSIIGGLYSIGYSADSLEKLVLTTDWDELFRDKVKRQNISLDERLDQERFIAVFPILERKIILPGGLISGQNVSMLFSRLSWDAKGISDFNQFPIPFCCVATDINTGKAVILNKGYLPDAIRASMAIPSVFNPIEIDGKLLVDGGLVDNLPAKLLKEMGADIIIGVNVGFKPFSKDELNTMMHMVLQTVFINTMDGVKNNEGVCNILITPELDKYNMMSFNRADSLVMLGEKAARLHLGELKALADSLSKFGDKPLPITLQKHSETVSIQNVQFEGLEHVSQEFILGKLRMQFPSSITLNEIEEAIDRMYGSQFFEKVSYKVIPTETGNILVLRFIEKGTDQLRLGIHYDSDFNAKLLINATYRNLLRKGSKLSLDAMLAENPRFKVNYLLYTGWKPNKSFLSYKRGGLRPDIGFSIEGNSYKILQTYDGIEGSKFNFYEALFQIYMHRIVINSTQIMTGIEQEFSLLKSSTVTSSKTYNFSFLNAFTHICIDTRDKNIFASRGTFLELNGKIIFDAYKGSYPSQITQVYLKNTNIWPLNKRLSLINHIYAGSVFGDSIPFQYHVFSGGVESSLNKAIMPFVGMSFLQSASRNSMVAGLDLQLRLWTNNYVTAKYNIGRTAKTYQQIFTLEDLMHGAGISYAYASPIGPLEIILMKSNQLNDLQLYVNLGYTF